MLIGSKAEPINSPPGWTPPSRTRVVYAIVPPDGRTIEAIVDTFGGYVIVKVRDLTRDRTERRFYNKIADLAGWTALVEFSPEVIVSRHAVLR